MFYRIQPLDYHARFIDVFHVNLQYSIYSFSQPWVPIDYFNVIIPPYNLFITILIFERHCVELLYLPMICLTVASLHGTVCLCHR